MKVTFMPLPTHSAALSFSHLPYDQQSTYLKGLLQRAIDQGTLNERELIDVNDALCGYKTPDLVDLALDVAAHLDNIIGILPGLKNLIANGATQITDPTVGDDLICSALDIIYSLNDPFLLMEILNAAQESKNNRVIAFLNHDRYDAIQKDCIAISDVRLYFFIPENFSPELGISFDPNDDYETRTTKLTNRFAQLSKLCGSGQEIICFASVFYGGHPHLSEDEKINVALRIDELNVTLRTFAQGIAPRYDLICGKNSEVKLYHAKLKKPDCT